MKRYLIITGLLATGLTPASHAQQQRRYELKGFMGVQGGESFTYKLDLHDSTGNILSGYAYTYAKEPNSVKAYVTATVDRAGKTLNIREQEILSNNYFESRATICLVEALLTYNVQARTISGPLITKTSGNGANCSSGSITFSSAAELDQLFNPPPPPAAEPATAKATTPAKTQPAKTNELLGPDDNPFIGNAAKQPRQQPAAVAPKADNITEGKDKTYLWKTGQVQLEVWDGNTVDNDKITILYNGQEILSNYVLTKEKKKLVLPIGGNELNIITVIALNEGNEPPNTANIQLTDGTETYDVIAHNTIGKRALIRIKKQP